MSGLASSALGLSACGGKSDGYVPPEIGTQIAWKYVSENAVDDDLVTVVASGPDFAIFKQTLDDAYYVEFSGIGYSNCEDEEQPSRKDRTAVFSAWPLEVGKEIAWQSDKITIEKTGETDLGSSAEPVFWFIHDYADADSENDYFAVSPRYRMALELKWPNDERDYVVSITSPSVVAEETQEGYKLLDGVSLADLNTCAKLLSETTPITVGEEN